MAHESALERFLRRDRWVVTIGLSVVALGAVAYTVLGIGMPMSAIEMTEVSVPSGMAMMAPVSWTASYFMLVLLMWWGMMTAMMVPSASPTILLYAALRRHSGGTREIVWTSGTFMAGYLTIWGAFSLAATVLQWTLELRAMMSPMTMTLTSKYLGASVLLAAGLYQFTPIKQSCLRHCRDPVRFLTKRRRPGSLGAFLMGVEHGAFCVGCCWFLMALLFVGGVMNLYWIAGLALFVLLEKLLPAGHWLGLAVGATLIAWAFLLLTGTSST